MLVYTQKLNINPALFESFDALPQQVAFFDIETTGLSAEANFIYLICVGYLKEGSPVLLQWFAETPADEPELLKAFSEFMDEYRVLAHFNGATFDIPFVERKAEKYGITVPFAALKSVDILKLIRPLKKVFGLSGCSQKAIEKWLGIAREDKYNGGELIEVYKQYLGRARYDKMKHGTPLKTASDSGLATMPETPSEALLYLLLLHNAEDVENLIRISGLMPVLKFLNNSEASEDAENQLHFTLEMSTQAVIISFSFPEYATVPELEISQSEEAGGRLFLSPRGCQIVLPFLKGELKYFFEDYKNYYYLPDEDFAVHKSVGAGVDKDHRKNATASTCYIKKADTYIAFGANQCQQVFKTDFKSSLSYIPLSKLQSLDIAAAVWDFVGTLR